MATDPSPDHQRSREPSWNFVVLRALEVRFGQHKVHLERTQARLIVAILLVAGAPVSRKEMIKRIWSDDLEDSTNEKWWRDRGSDLTTIVSRTRSALNAVQPGSGKCFLAPYEKSVVTLQTHRSMVDLHRFNDACNAAKSAQPDPARAATLWRAALAEWGGPTAALNIEPLAGLPGRWAANRRRFLRERLLLTLLDYYRAELALGEHERMLPGLQQLASLDPPNDDAVGLRMLALYRSGRSTEARQFFTEYRQQVFAQSKRQPDPALIELYRGIQQQDPNLYWRNQGVRHPMTERRTITIPAGNPSTERASATASLASRPGVPAGAARPSGTSDEAGRGSASSAGSSPADGPSTDQGNAAQTNTDDQQAEPSENSAAPGTRPTIHIGSQTIDGGVVVYGGTITGSVIGTQNVGVIGTQRNHGRDT